MPWHRNCSNHKCPLPGRYAGNGMGILLIAITAVAIFGPSLDAGPIFSSRCRQIIEPRDSMLEPVLLPGMAPFNGPCQ